MQKGNAVKVIIGRVKPDVKISCHAELVSASSTLVVSQRQQQRQAWKTPNQVWGDNPICNNNKAFTLIELLVVVLIIGILAAVALPQYKLAVQKAELANYRSLANSVAQGAISHHLASGEWPQSIEELDIELPQLGQKSLSWAGCVYNNKMYCCLSRPVPSGSYGDITCGKADYSFAYSNLFANDIGQVMNQHSCFSKSGLKICEATGATLNNDNAYLATPQGPLGSRKYVYLGAER